MIFQMNWKFITDSSYLISLLHTNLEWPSLAFVNDRLLLKNHFNNIWIENKKKRKEKFKIFNWKSISGIGSLFCLSFARSLFLSLSCPIVCISIATTCHWSLKNGSNESKGKKIWFLLLLFFENHNTIRRIATYNKQHIVGKTLDLNFT